MNTQNQPPHFDPQRMRGNSSSHKVGDSVGVDDRNGNEVVAKIVSVSMGGRIKAVADGIEYYGSPSDFRPIPTGAGQQKAITPSSVAAHLKAGGEAFYTPSRERYGPDPGMLDFDDKKGEPERIPLHTTWLGKKKNLKEYVNFEDVAAGKAQIAFSPPAPKSADTGDKTRAALAKAGRDESKGGQSAKPNAGLDAIQNTLDGVGVVGDAVVPGSGVAADGTNTVLSLMRAAADKENRGEHLKNAGISAVSMVPFVGDLAKVFKHGGKAAGAAAKSQKTGRPDRDRNASDVVASLIQGSRSSGSSPPEGDAPVAGGRGGDGGPPSSTAGGNDDGLGDNVKPLTDRFVELTGVVGKASAATIAAATSIDLMNKAAIEYRRDLMKYNGTIAGAYGKLDADRAGRSVREGGEMSGPLSNLIGKQSKLESALQDFASPYKQAGTDVQAGLTELATIAVKIIDYIEPFSEMYPYLRKYLEKWGAVDPVGKHEADSTGWMDKIQQRARDNAKKPRKV